MKKFGVRVWGIARSVPGWLTAAAAVVMLVAPAVASGMADVSAELGVDWSSQVELVGVWGVRLAGWLTAAALIMRRVMEVPSSVVGVDKIENLVVAYEAPNGGLAKMPDLDEMP